jgi:hypothetical protein
VVRLRLSLIDTRGRNASKFAFMFIFKRVHDGGTEAIIRLGTDGWNIQINLKEPDRDSMPIVGYQRRTLESAKAFATSKFSDTAMSVTGRVRSGKNFSLVKISPGNWAYPRRCPCASQQATGFYT